MGAKQSKRSVDISGKEADGAGEVAAAGAGGEGRVEAIADIDNLKPQLNGDTPHIEPPEEKTEKEKQLDSGTPENEKDATTEKETEGEKKDAPLTNGESEHKPEAEKENGETPAPEETKKPKKEKVKKKWSLRSISFSRKDKPKHEKKEKKEEEVKTNGDAEKLPEEAAEATEVTTETQAAEESKPAETKDEKSPETPVTEPLTNGSSTPESPKVVSPAEPTAPLSDRPETEAVAAPAPAPDQLPLNGLSIEESTKEVTEVAETVESKTEEPAAPAPEIPAKIEVCVERMSSIDSTPPPLPASPPPSSVATFAATTMAPELVDASPINTTESALPDIPITETEAHIETQEIISNTEPTITVSTIPSETINSDMSIKDDILTETVQIGMAKTDLVNDVEIEPVVINDTPMHNNESEEAMVNIHDLTGDKDDVPIESTPQPDDIVQKVPETIEPEEETESHVDDIIKQNGDEAPITSHHNGDHISNGIDCDVNGDHDMNGDHDETEQENIKNKTKDSMTNGVEEDYNGIIDKQAPATIEEMKAIVDVDAEEEALPSPPSEVEASPAPSPSPPPPPQDVLPVQDKMADLIPEMPDLPTETPVIQDTTTDVAVAN